MCGLGDIENQDNGLKVNNSSSFGAGYLRQTSQQTMLLKMNLSSETCKADVEEAGGTEERQRSKATLFPCLTLRHLLVVDRFGLLSGDCILASLEWRGISGREAVVCWIEDASRMQVRVSIPRASQFQLPSRQVDQHRCSFAAASSPQPEWRSQLIQ